MKELIENVYLWVVRDKWLLALLLLAIFILIWTLPAFVRMQDEGMLASSAMHVMSGKVLYRDVFEFWPPLSVYVTSAAFYVFGANVWAMRSLAALLMLLNFICFYCLISQLSTSQVFKTVSSLIFMAVFFAFVGLSHHLFGMLFLLLTIICLSRLIELRSKFWAAMSGFFTALTALSMQLEGFVAIGLCILVLAACFRSVTHVRVWSSALLAGLGPILITVVYFYAVGALPDVVYSVLMFPLEQYREVNGVFGSVSQAALLIILLIYSKTWIQSHSSAVAKLWFVAALLWTTIFLLSEYSGISTRFSFFTLIILLSLMGAHLKSKLLSNVLYSISKSRGYLALVKGAVVITLVFVGLLSPSVESLTLWRNIALANTPITSKSGIMYARDEVANKVQFMIDYVEHNTLVGEQVYFGPFSAQYQLLTLRQSPIGYSQITPKYNPDWMVEEAVQHMQDAKVNTIVLLPMENPFKFTQENSLSRYITKNYKQVVCLEYATLLPSRPAYHESYERQLKNTPGDGIWRLKE